ncbi:MAG TPA: hypothetical protein VNY07_12820 [Chthoniobacterales bacterium]|jgi:hypothetical protein|nr:hypothetical protein [Chthoniobacterales bacterium]
MKLANSWAEDAPTAIASEAFHDEVEEHDEGDEVKDGCGGVAWQPYVLKKPHTSNERLHELAREIRGVEKKRGKKLTATQYKAVFDKWECGSRPFLRAEQDHFTEFLAKLDCVSVPKGETLKAAFERAKSKPPPEKILLHSNIHVRLFANLCRELQEMAGDQPFMLCQMSVAKMFGHSSHRNISNWIKACKTLDIVRVAEPWRQGKATRYFYIE